jgi:DNA polymerase-3 subunit delta'
MKSSNKKEINVSTVPLPKSSDIFIGNNKAIDTLTAIIGSGKLPQSWLFLGPKGIGKATLAYRFARGLLAGANDLSVPVGHPVFSKVLAGSHSDLLVLEPEADSASGEIKVEAIRKISDFLRLTSSETKYRIVIIDSADDMNTNSANALLKLLEEPPHNALFILISHAPGKLLPTIKSRCRNLKFNPLNEIEAFNVLQYATPDIQSYEVERIIKLSAGSPGVAAWLYYNEGIKIYDCLIAILSVASKIESAKVQQLSYLVTKKDDKVLWEVMAFLLDSLLVRIIKNAASPNAGFETIGVEDQIKNKLLVEKPLEELIKIWEKFKSLVADTDRINLDKKAVIISIFEEFNFLS